MKFASVFSFIFFLQFVAMGQNPFLDAQYLMDRMDSSGTIVLTNEVKELLGHYYTDVESFDITSIYLESKPFMDSLFADQGADEAGEGLPGNKKSFLSSVGGLNVTKLVNALANVMIERAKQELTVSFFERFKTFANEHPEFEVLFPKTTRNLSHLLSIQYPQMIPALRYGFMEDIQLLTYHLEDLLTIPHYVTLFERHPEVRICIRSLRLFHQLESADANVADLIVKIAALDEWKEDQGNLFKNTAGMIQFAALFSESLRDDNENQIWVGGNEIRRFIKEPKFAKLYFGLLCRQVTNKNIQFFNIESRTVGLDTLMAAQQHHLSSLQRMVLDFSQLSSKVDMSLSRLNDLAQTEGHATSETIYTYIDLSLDMLDYAVGVSQKFTGVKPQGLFITVSRQANELFRDAYSQQYTQLIVDAADLMVEISDETGNDLAAFVDRAQPYALFMANVAESNSEEEIQAALENIILPVGSSSIKKNSNGNLAVQSYLGAFVATPDVKRENGAWSDPFGVSAPIGISWTPGALSWGKGGSLSLFGELLDIGAVVDYKLKSERDVNNPDPNATVVVKDYSIELGQIFSPGVFLVYGAGANLPLSLGMGAQYGPGLSKITNQNLTVERNPSWRYSLFLSVDLPLFNLANTIKQNDR